MNRKLKMRNCLRRISDKFPSQFPRPDVGSKVAESRLSFSLYDRPKSTDLAGFRYKQKVVFGTWIKAVSLC